MISITQIDIYLYQDLNTAVKIKKDPNFYTRLEIADRKIKSLNIKNEKQYYAYVLFIPEFINIDYDDTLAFTRFQNQEYYEYVQTFVTFYKKSADKTIKQITK